MMALPFDTTLHYVAVHMHPYAESVELRDVTADRSIFKSHARNLSGEIGLANVEYFSSIEGVPVYKDHEYELISVYDNTTDEDQDSMAVMYAYFLDQNYQGPDPSLAHSAAMTAAPSATPENRCQEPFQARKTTTARNRSSSGRAPRAP